MQFRRKLAAVAATAACIVGAGAGLATAASSQPPPRDADGKGTATANGRADRPWLPREGMKSAMSGGNTVGGVVREARPRADGYRHIDTPRLIRRLRQLHVNTYTFGIWDSPTDWDDLREEFAPAAKRAGIDVMVYLVPPSECFDDPDPVLTGRCSRPYKLDFESWAREIARLSQRYSNVTSWAIDDFLVGDNARLFTRDYLLSVARVARDINPDLGFYTTAYHGTAVDEAFYTRFEGAIDGIIYPYLDAAGNTSNASRAEQLLDQVRAKADAHDMSVILLTYSGRFLDAPLPPTARYIEQLVDTGLRYTRQGKIDGVLSYATPLDGRNRIDNDQAPLDGDGRLALTLPTYTPTKDGDYAEASQVVKVDPRSPRYELSFWHRDPYAGGLWGYHMKQLLINDRVVWQRDLADPWMQLWLNGSDHQGPIDVTSLVRGRDTVKIAFRLFEQQGVGAFPADLGFDEVEAIGLDVKDPGFEDGRPWTTTSTTPGLQATVQVYHRDEPERIFRTVSRAFGRR